MTQHHHWRGCELTGSGSEDRAVTASVPAVIPFGVARCNGSITPSSITTADGVAEQKRKSLGERGNASAEGCSRVPFGLMIRKSF
jgi:hypothetical protein